MSASDSAVAEAAAEAPPPTTFAALGIDLRLVKAVRQLGLAETVDLELVLAVEEAGRVELAEAARGRVWM